MCAQFNTAIHIFLTESQILIRARTSNGESRGYNGKEVETKDRSVVSPFKDYSRIYPVRCECSSVPRDENKNPIWTEK